jgi:hypothetical protein
MKDFTKIKSFRQSAFLHDPSRRTAAMRLPTGSRPGGTQRFPGARFPRRNRFEDGPVVKLVEVDDMEMCEVEARFTVPDVEPGRYVISVFVWDQPASEGYGVFLPHEFEVLVDAPAPG